MRACAATVALSVGLSACGSARTEGHPATQTTVALAAATTHAHPFTASLWQFYRQSGRQLGVANVIDEAEQSVESQCMRRADFSYHPVPVEPVSSATVLDGLASTPGPDAPPERALLAIERRQGFGIAERVRRETSPGPQENSRYFASLRPSAQRRYLHALYGSRGSVVHVRFPDGSLDSGPAGGCLATSSKIVYGSVARDDFRLNAVVDVTELVDRAINQQRVTKASTPLWSSCLAEATHRRFASQDALIAWLTDLYGQSGLSKASARDTEIRYAIQSTRCMYRTGAERTYAAETWKVLSHMPTRWYRTLTSVHAWDAVALARARRILTRSS